MSWSWLAARFDRNKDGVVTADELKGSARLFRALDRDGDEAVTSEDLDWSPRSRYLQGRAQARGRFAQMDRNGNGRVTLAEWEKAFEQAANGKTFLTQDDVAALLYPRPRPEAGGERREVRPARRDRRAGRSSRACSPARSGRPPRGRAWVRKAPAFTLETHDKSRRISLADYRGKKPVVLIFGSFT